MGPLYEAGWQKRSRTKSCGEYQHSNSFSQRRQSAPSVILSKALTKSKPVARDCASQVSQDIFALIQSLLSPIRKLICQGNVVLQTGLQTQERFLILFNDLLIITKAKSVMQVKQKKCVRVSEMWTASCVDEVCEASTVSERSFVMGWPTYNCVATFSTSEEKDRWLPLIESCIQEEKKSDDPKMIPLKIFAKDVGNCAYAKTLFISNTDRTSDVISTALQQFGLSGGIKYYKLWVCSKQDETPYPLIGHECPYSIKMSHIRLLQQEAVTSSHSQMALLPIDAHCQFFLRPSQISSTFTAEQKSRRMSLISWAFKRGFSIEQAVQSASPGPTITPASGHLFGRPLSDVIKDNTLPSPIVDMLKCLCSEGAVTRGIFRRSAGVKACRELREKLDSGHYEEPLSGEPVLVTASVFKEFLRNIPGSLLCEELYEQWLQAVEQDGERNGQMTERLVQLLPEENLLLLRHMIAMLHHIQLNAEHNQMTSFNLAVCIAPSCLWNRKIQSHEKDAKKVCDLVRVLIDNCCALFGDEIITLLKDLTEDNRSNRGSVGSLQQMSDSGYESLKNEVNTDTEDISKTRPLKGSHSMDSLMSLSDCELDCPENDLLSSSPLAQIRNCTSAVRQLLSLKLHKHSMSTIALTSHEQEITIQSGKHKEFKRSDEVNDNVFLDQTFQQLNFMREKQTPPTSSVSSPVTSPTYSPVSSIDSPFSLSTRKTLHSPQDSPAKVDLLTQNGTDYQHSNSLPNEKLSPPNNQRNFTDIKGGLQPKMPKNPPPYQQALQKLNRKPFSQTPTQTPLHKGKGLFYKGPGSPTHSPLGDPKVSPDPQTIRFTCQTRTEEEVKLPQSVFYGQSCKLTVHKIRGQKAGLKSTKLSGQQLRFKALDLHPSSGKIVRDYLGLREKQAVGRGQKLSCCSSSQWIV
ncbi:rho GTPase-activating protein 20 isoform X3 [Sinocyclocheilus rhinocerous]|uniref:rho GTPase-activating protein 20 isoform X3 n=1 Tax=Sinocyclocheilus rhinocerous TaxID=307959 RepID=UPI0007B97D97|nr:PREDICTED: rho GTPase-activating protein 20-like isoform X3 [Sinocyclocheilus rhinocerous]